MFLHLHLGDNVHPSSITIDVQNCCGPLFSCPLYSSAGSSGPPTDGDGGTDSALMRDCPTFECRVRGLGKNPTYYCFCRKGTLT
ncbi:hypothetical protein CEXT_494051 [Caerostris extrusa]|uniref:Uncharacterized protein n=1 Tax=Caerostris extrusa TaxID=172846 RepID=A0AAV4VZI0_CAEEX|nr:hypothetical protein CEXT_494051 [Caerostris extrusa]